MSSDKPKKPKAKPVSDQRVMVPPARHVRPAAQKPIRRKPR